MATFTRKTLGFSGERNVIVTGSFQLTGSQASSSYSDALAVSGGVRINNGPVIISIPETSSFVSIEPGAGLFLNTETYTGGSTLGLIGIAPDTHIWQVPNVGYDDSTAAFTFVEVDAGIVSSSAFSSDGHDGQTQEVHIVAGAPVTLSFYSGLFIGAS
jgi:hypothetical protein